MHIRYAYNLELRVETLLCFSFVDHDVMIMIVIGQAAAAAAATTSTESASMNAAGWISSCTEEQKSR